MILDSNFKLEYQPKKTEEKSKQNHSTLSILLYDFNTFKKEVKHFKNHYQGPDYFNFLDEITDLQNLIDTSIYNLKTQLGDLDELPYRALSNSLDYPFKKNKIQVNTDEEGISLMLSRLTHLIETNRKAVLEVERSEEFFIESLLHEFEKELEKSKWIFSLYSKY